MRRVVYLLPRYKEFPRVGGMVSHTAGVIRGLGSRGINVIFWAPHIPFWLPKEANILHLRKDNQDPLPWFIQALTHPKLVSTELAETIKEINPLFVYQRHVIFSDMFYRLKREGVDSPLVLEYNNSIVWAVKHGTKGWKKILGSLISGIVGRLEKRQVMAADYVITPSPYFKEVLSRMGYPRERVLVNPNGVDAEFFDPEKWSGEGVRERYGLEGKTAVTMISTFERRHGAHVLAKAVKHVVKEHPDVVFLFVGDGKFRGETEGIVREEGVEANVVFTGTVPREEVPEYLAASDIAVNPIIPPRSAQFFGSPIKLLEYMAMGKAIVTTSVGQMQGLVENGVDAMVVEPDNPKALAEAIVRLVEDEELRKMLGKNARKKVLEKYTWEKHVERILSFVGVG